SERTAMQANAIPGTTAVISGAPVLQVAVARALRLSLLSGMVTGIVSMALLLLLALRTGGGIRYRVLPLAAGVLTVFVLGGAVTAVHGRGAVRPVGVADPHGPSVRRGDGHGNAGRLGDSPAGGAGGAVRLARGRPAEGRPCGRGRCGGGGAPVRAPAARART